MQTTQTYHLSQWEPSDRLLMKDFNEDNAKTDAALAALATQVAQRATQAALETLRQEAAAATAALRAETATAMEAVRVGAATATEAVRAGAASATEAVRAEAAAAVASARAAANASDQLVRLLDITTNTAAAQVDLDLSLLHIQDYYEIIVVPSLSFPSTSTIAVYLNNKRGSIYECNGSTKGHFLSYPSTSLTSLKFHPFSDLLRGSSTTLDVYGRGDVVFSKILPSFLTPAQFSFLSFATSNGALIAAGGKFTVYGVKS